MNYTKYYNYEDQTYTTARSFVKFNCLNLINSILLIVWIILAILTANSVSKYGLDISVPLQLPRNINALRAWFLFVLIAYFLVASWIIDNVIIYIKRTRCKTLALMNCIIPFACLLSFIHYDYRCYYLTYWSYLKMDRSHCGLQISHGEFWLWLTRRIRVNKLVRNTILFYVALIFFTVGLGFIFSDYDDHKISNNFFIFNALSFFTQENNFLCWLFLILFCFFHKKMLFKNNTWLIYAASYILIVGFVADVMIGPYLCYDDNIKEFNTAYPIVKFLWFHVFDPIIFVWFAINSMAQNYEYPIKYSRFLNGFLRYPLFYGIYLYSVPFLCNYSIYGKVTNLNPHMLYEQASSAGEPVWILGAFAMLIFFILVGSLMRFINLKIIKNYDLFKTKKY